MRRKRNRPTNPLRLGCLLRIRWGEGGRRPDEVSAGEWEESQGDKSKHSRLWTLDLGLWTQQNCTISAPFLHRFSHFSGTRSLIINDLQNFLHRDIVSQSFSFHALRFTA